ncbi:hypothetical protein HH308_21855 [Gordonia sp. TBRC 11910]|uniref:Uncharacterized protein n=1 Tax=Gordonia asplenii TaxID=2725283 RepID=A0A848L063_9ACTN|nr:hypothetical protein [Gordonia asplenii]NMO03862.1 hypothetical protein [Gordonia asplenii]
MTDQLPQTGVPQGKTQQAPSGEQGNPFAGFSIGAVIALVGAILALASYPLVWYIAKDDNDATINGFGSTHSTASTEVTFESSKIHWAVLAAGIGMLIVVVARFIGRYSAEWVRPTFIIPVIGVAGAIVSAVFVDGAFKLGIGVYLAIVGSLLMLAGGVIIASLKK